MKQVEFRPEGRYGEPCLPTLDDVRSGRVKLPHPTSGKKIAMAAVAAAMAGLMAGCGVPVEELIVPYEPQIVEPDPPPVENEIEIGMLGGLQTGVPMEPWYAKCGPDRYLTDNQVRSILRAEAKKAGIRFARWDETMRVGEDAPLTLDAFDETAGVGLAWSSAYYLQEEFDRERNELAGPEEVSLENFNVIPFSDGYAVASENAEGREVYSFVANTGVRKSEEEELVRAFWEFIGWLQWEGLL